MSDRLIHAILTPCPAPYEALFQPNDAGVSDALFATLPTKGGPYGQA